MKDPEYYARMAETGSEGRSTAYAILALTAAIENITEIGNFIVRRKG